MTKNKNILIFASIAIVAMSIIVRIIMYIKCRSLSNDEAYLAVSIVSRSWLELLATPLSGDQSAPVLYVIAVKAIGSIFEYSEGSLRIFSFFAFIGLLILEVIFLKKNFNFNNCKICFVVVMSALLPSYIWYSNELKPYMSDALFVLLVIFLYFYYTQGKINLPILTGLYILILGFSSPAVFFIGGTLSFEFVSAILNKNKKQMLYIAISGIVTLVIFALYYHWWLSPASEFMKIWWGKYFRNYSIVLRIVRIFSIKDGGRGFLVWFFVPFALLGIYSLCKSKNKIAWSVALSLLLVCLASSIGKWPLAGRLWLFLPAIVFIFTPIGADIVLNKTKNKKIMNAIEFSFLVVLALYLSICLECTKHRMYYPTTEINPLISYVQENIKDDEKLYVHGLTISPFLYKNGYNVTKIGNATDNNIIYGNMFNEWEAEVLGGNDIQSILENKKTYLLFANHLINKNSRFLTEKDLTVLQKYGTLTEIMNVYDTPLYYFERNEVP
ncbi:MAG: hypothetical protein LBC87_02190 [Fibromonadaceae bacterium]|jgi:hypothetical protein|nr:hypothetical protein [Fibromonadaceae bacterium]